MKQLELGATKKTQQMLTSQPRRTKTQKSTGGEGGI